jgi:hypothetical protein
MYPLKPLIPVDIGLILSYKCQCACAHCLYNCGPEWSEWMSVEDIRSALEAMTLFERSLQVHITGGEPFLNFPRLLSAVEAANQLGIPCYAETNAGWCVREDLVAERFTILRQAGLQAILISCSPFHAETISPARTLMAIQIAQRVFGAERVIVYLPEWIDQVTRFELEEPTPLYRYIEVYGESEAGKLFWEGYGLIPGGRSGYRLGHLRRRDPASVYKGQNCAVEILYAHHSHFDLYGNYISGFCGGLTIGSWRKLQQLRSDFSTQQYPPLIAILTNSGAYGLYDLARREFDYKPRPDGYAGKCHLCVDVRRHLVGIEDFPELEPQEFYRMI